MDGEFAAPMSFTQRRASFIESDDDDADDEGPLSIGPSTPDQKTSKRSNASSHPRPLPTPTRPTASPIPQNLPLSAPASPPTPAPSPIPHQRIPTWANAGENEDAFLRDARSHFSQLRGSERQRFLAEILNLCDLQQLGFVHGFVSPRLKKDPFHVLPNELCLRILSFVDDPRTLARASQVSNRWHDLLGDDMTWKILCDKHAYTRLAESTLGSPKESVDADSDVDTRPSVLRPPPVVHQAVSLASARSLDSSFSSSPSGPQISAKSFDSAMSIHGYRRRLKTSYKSHFKQKYMVETAWRSGGKAICHHVTPDQGVVTSLHLTPKYIVVALDNAKIHVYSTEGEHQKTLSGHVMGVWAMVPWGDMLVSGGCDRDVRVWDMSTGENVHCLRGHTSTVRCLKMSDTGLAISGSRDTTLRIWDIETGICRNVLVGHQASVRCLDIHGDIVVSGSYDTTAKIWSISEGRCLGTLTGHFSQIYAIAYDGNCIATGSLDTSVRIWDPHSGMCRGILQGHTSLVGQLQMRGNTLVTGGSDGSVRVWSLKKLVAIHRLAAHDNSVTSLQFDETRVVSGGSDGRVKIWDLKTGQLVRELGTPAETVWRVAFEDEKAVIMGKRASKTIMEVWSFSPPEEDIQEISRLVRSDSPASLPPEALMSDDTDGETRMSDVVTDQADADSSLPDLQGVSMRD